MKILDIRVHKFTIIGSNNGSSPGRRQAIIWTIVEILLIGLLGTSFSEIFIEIYKFSFKKTQLQMSSGKRRPLSFGLNMSAVFFRATSLELCLCSIHEKHG